MITVVGSLNLDLLVDAPRLPSPGETVLGGNFRRSPGGKGANQAFAAARMGHPVTLLGAVGDDPFGEEILRDLASVGVDVGHIARRARMATGTALIVVDASGQNQIVVAPGANASLDSSWIESRADVIEKSKAVVAQLETPMEATETAFRLGRQAGAINVLNPAPFQVIAPAIFSLCDWVAPNEIEAAGMLGMTAIRSIEEAAIAAREIRKRTACPNVALTLGAEGVWLDGADFVGHVPGFRVEARDTVGAGDAFIGGLVVRLLEKASAEEAARFACAVAALAVMRPGAQAGIPQRSEVEAFLRSEE